MMKARVIGLTSQRVMQNRPRLGEEPRGRRFKSYRPDFPNQRLRGGQRDRLFVYTRFYTRVAYRLAYFFPLSNTLAFSLNCGQFRAILYPAACASASVLNGAQLRSATLL